MALKPTIFKLVVSVADLDRDYYDTLNLTVAQHPSETLERMLARLLAYCLNAREGLAFTAGLSTPDQPDIWARSLDDRLLCWIDVGEPAFDRIKKATHLTGEVTIYSFNSKSAVWWRQECDKYQALAVGVYQFAWPGMQAAAALLVRTMELSLTISGDTQSDKTLYLAAERGSAEVVVAQLQTARHADR